jgi:hypothetical protein
MARKGGVPRERGLNAFDLEALQRWLDERRTRPACFRRGQGKE